MYSGQQIAEYGQNSIARLGAELQENNAKLAGFATRNAVIEASLNRLNRPLPRPDACPECFYEHDVIALMRSVGTPEGGDPGVDYYRCENRHGD